MCLAYIDSLSYTEQAKQQLQPGDSDIEEKKKNNRKLCNSLILIMRV